MKYDDAHFPIIQTNIKFGMHLQWNQAIQIFSTIHMYL